MNAKGSRQEDECFYISEEENLPDCVKVRIERARDHVFRRGRLWSFEKRVHR